MLPILILILLVLAFGAFAFEAWRTRSLIAVGLALWVLAVLLLSLPKTGV